MTHLDPIPATTYDPTVADLSYLYEASEEQLRAWVFEAQIKVSQLQRAMASRASIEQAKGVLMAAHGVTAEKAFLMLRATSQSTNTKVVAVVEELLQRVTNLHVDDTAPDVGAAEDAGDETGHPLAAGTTGEADARA